MSEDQSPILLENAAATQPVIATTMLTDPIGVAAGTYVVMLREIRSWGIWSLVLGALHLISAGFLSAPWGLLLLTVGLASFYIREPAMFVIYGVTLTWAAVSNITSGQTSWIVFALLQLYLAFRVFRKFRLFRQSHANYVTLLATTPGGLPPAVRAGRVFPVLALGLGLLALTGLVALIAGVVVMGSVGMGTFSGLLDLLISMVVNLGVLGLAVGLAALLSGYRYKLAAVGGLTASTLVVLIWLVLVALTGAR